MHGNTFGPKMWIYYDFLFLYCFLNLHCPGREDTEKPTSSIRRESKGNASDVSMGNYTTIVQQVTCGILGPSSRRYHCFGGRPEDCSGLGVKEGIRSQRTSSYCQTNIQGLIRCKTSKKYFIVRVIWTCPSRPDH